MLYDPSHSQTNMDVRQLNTRVENGPITQKYTSDMCVRTRVLVLSISKGGKIIHFTRNEQLHHENERASQFCRCCCPCPCPIKIPYAARCYLTTFCLSLPNTTRILWVFLFFSSIYLISNTCVSVLQADIKFMAQRFKATIENGKIQWNIY